MWEERLSGSLAEIISDEMWVKWCLVTCIHGDGLAVVDGSYFYQRRWLRPARKGRQSRAMDKSADVASGGGAR